MTSQDPHPPSGPEPRRDPALGRFDELQFAAPSRDRQADAWARHLRASGWRWIAVLAIVVALLLVVRQPVADWLWPETRAGRLRAQAEQALAEGRLTAPDGTGARELYVAALALDPDRSDARAGLDRVGRAALAQARGSLARRQFAQARQYLDLADDLSVPRAQSAALREQLRRSEAAVTGIDVLLRDAAAARAAGRLEGESGALPLYQRVLELEPDRTAALEGREDTLADLLQQARSRLDAGDLEAATAVVRRVQAADPGHVELPDTLAELGRAAEARRREAGRSLRRGQLAQALSLYEAVLLVDPDDADALAGVQAVAAAHARRSEQLAGDYRFAEAEARLRQAESIAGAAAAEHPAIAAARQHLQRSRQAQRQGTGKAPSAAQRRRLDQLLAEAAQSQARGDLLTPPGDSAFDKLRAARAIAPQDARVRAATARLATAAGECYRAALAGNRLVRAGACLDARRALEGDTAAVRAGRTGLAQHWIELGDQRLSAGEVAGAQAALQAARALDPAADGLAAFAGRLRAATLANEGEDGVP